MPRIIVGLDISEDTVTAVQVKSLMQGYQITGCGAVPITEAGGISVALRAVCEQVDSKNATCISVVPDGQLSFRNVNMPFTDLKKIRQTLAFELETMMASPIEELLTDFIVLDQATLTTSLLSGSVNRTYLAEYLETFEPFGVEPEILDVRNVPLVNQILKQGDTPENGLFLNIGSQKCTMILFVGKKTAMVRQLSFAGQDIAEVAARAAKREKQETFDNEKHEAALLSLCRSIKLTMQGFRAESGRDERPEKTYITGSGSLVESTKVILQKSLDLPVSMVDLKSMEDNIQLSAHLSSLWNPSLMDNALALALRDTKKGKNFNFRREEFQVKTQFVKLKKEFIHASIYLAIISILLAVNLGVDYIDLKKRTANLDGQIKEVFTQTFPEIKNIVEPMHQMKTQIDELKKSAGSAPGINTKKTILDLLSDISKRIPKSLEMKVDRMVVDQDGIQLKGTTDNFNTVDSIKKGLEESPLYSDVVIASANLDRSGKGVRFEIKMQRVL
jgi:general secretion pathway protein L